MMTNREFVIVMMIGTLFGAIGMQLVSIQMTLVANSGLTKVFYIDKDDGHPIGRYLPPPKRHKNETMYFTPDGKRVYVRNDILGTYVRTCELGTAWDTYTVIKEWGGFR
jgi:hypothetical protein